MGVAALNLLAFDFGASSGRAMLGVLDGGKLALREVHRFANEPVMLCGRFVWDLPRLVYEMKQALLKLARAGIALDGIGIDTWGADYGLLDARGRLLSLPVHYRDERTRGMREAVREFVSDEALYERTGTAYNPFNTLYQLLAMKREDDPALTQAASLLFMPDLLAYFLTGERGVDYTMASTASMLNPETRDWDRELLQKLGLPTGLLGEVRLPGYVRGRLLPEVAAECGVGQVPVIAVGGHDTSSAVLAVPAREKDFAYLSSGTWSLLGASLAKPMRGEQARLAGYTNEGGADGSIRFLKNITGLWIIQACKREWDRRQDAADYAELVSMAMSAPPFKAIIDVDDPCFLAPGDMPNRIRAYCELTDQPVPKGRGEISRVVYESLALKYRWSLERLEALLGRRFEALHIVGGGSKNALLNRFTAEAIRRPAICGPGEATAVGNLLMQALTLGAIRDVAELRRAASASFPVRTFAPETDGSVWDAAYDRYLKLFAP